MEDEEDNDDDSDSPEDLPTSPPTGNWRQWKEEDKRLKPKTALFAASDRPQEEENELDSIVERAQANQDDIQGNVLKDTTL
ncbi:hypothetical protein J6590_082312 [Homalodisca vitripennis]|nr:hypothetical protein J6590_082312 [Homalodisca vitripennis]